MSYGTRTFPLIDATSLSLLCRAAGLQKKQGFHQLVLLCRFSDRGGAAGGGVKKSNPVKSPIYKT